MAHHPLTRTALYAVPAVGGAVLIAAHRSDAHAAATAIRHARLPFLVAALALAVLAMMNLAAFHAAAQRAAGIDVGTTELVVPVAAAGFLNFVVKSNGMAGLAPLIATSKRRSRSRGATVAGYLLVNVLGHVAFALVLGCGVLVLAVDGRFTRVDAIASAVFIVLAAVQALLIGAALRSRASIRTLTAVPHRIRRVLRRSPPAPSAIEHRHASADELYDAAQLVRANPAAVVPVAAHALVLETIGVAQLWCVLRALGENTRITVPLVAYAVSVLFTIVGFLPGGLGVVEIGLGALLVSFGLTAPAAAAAVVLYRVLELWFPLLVGMVAARAVARGSA